MSDPLIPKPPPTPSVDADLPPASVHEIHEFEVLDDEPAKPVTPSRAPPPLPIRASIPASAHKDPKAPVVLVVDDDPTLRTMLIRALGLTYNVFAAEDGLGALDLLARIDAPACIVSDWMMPKLDGVELAKRVRADARLKWTPVILLTAKNHPLDVVQGINAGARHYIAKPFKMKELLDKVANILATQKK